MNAHLKRLLSYKDESDIQHDDLHYFKQYKGRLTIFFTRNNLSSCIKSGYLHFRDIAPNFPIVISSVKQNIGQRQFKGVNISNVSKLDLEINSCSFKELLIADSEIPHLRLSKSEVGSSGLRILKSLDVGTTIDQFILEKTQINGPVSINAASINSLDIYQSQFSIDYDEHVTRGVQHALVIDRSRLENMKVYGGTTISSGVAIEYSQVSKLEICNDDISSANPAKIGEISINNCNIDNFKLSSSILRSIEIQKCDNINVIEIDAALFYSTEDNLLPCFLMEHTKCTFLKVRGMRSDREMFINEISIENGIIDDAVLDELKFGGFFLSNCFLRVSNLNCNTISFVNFINAGTIYVNNLSAVGGNGIVSMLNSDIGKVGFVNCHLDKWKFNFSNSRVLDIFNVNSRFPRTPLYGSNETTLANERDLFGQLQKVYEASGNKVNAIRANKLSLDAYLRQLRLKKKNVREFTDYLSLVLNKISNDFDYSLTRAAFSLIIVNTVFFCCFSMSLGYKPSLNLANFPRFLYVSSHWFEFLSPTHRIDFLKSFDSKLSLSPTGWTHLFDGLGKIIITYLIYQFVQAFRKLGKSR